MHILLRAAYESRGGALLELERSLVECKSEKKLLEWVDLGLDPLGEDMKTLLYSEMEMRIGLRKTDILAHPEEFRNFIRTLFGSGAVQLERLIVESLQLNSRFDAKLPEDLVDALKDMRRFLEISRIHQS